MAEKNFDLFSCLEDMLAAIVRHGWFSLFKLATRSRGLKQVPPTKHGSPDIEVPKPMT